MSKPNASSNATKSANISLVSGRTDIALKNITIGEALRLAAYTWPHREALVSVHQGISWTFKELLNKSENLAASLLSLGLEPGDRVGIWAPNCAEWTLTQFATALAGMILVNVNPDYQPRELEYALNKVGCKALITATRSRHSDYIDMLTELVPETTTCTASLLQSERIPTLKTLIQIGDSASPGFHLFADILASSDEKSHDKLQEVEGNLDPKDPINIQFTSGTTGAPKGATLSHHNILNNAYFVGLAQNLTPQDKVCVPVPLYHCFGMVMGTLACIQFGSTAVYPSERFNALPTLNAISEHRCTAVYGVPTMFIAMLEHPDFENFDLSHLRTGVMAGAPCPIEVMKKVISEMNMKEVTIGYGMTETSPISFQTQAEDPLEKRVTTVGRIHPHVEVKIIDEHGTVTPQGVKGELCTRGYSVMHGYWNDEEKTNESIDIDGWMRTGDLATLDELGYCDIVGRVKDMLIRGGENIFPREIEDFLFTHPDILEAQVFGVPDMKFGEEVCVWVRCVPGAVLNEEELRAYCTGKIAYFKIPRYIRFVEEYPLTVTGKIKKNVMREVMSQTLGLG